MSQKGYVDKVLSQFNMEKVKLVKTPIAAHFKLSGKLSPKSENEVQKMSKIPYSSAVGSLMYAMIYTCLDISQAISLVSCYMANLGKEY